MDDTFLGSSFPSEENPDPFFDAKLDPTAPSHHEPPGEATPPFASPRRAAEHSFGGLEPELPAGRKSSPELPAPRRDYLLPLSILVSGVLIAGSVLYAVGSHTLSFNGQTASGGGNQQANLAAAGGGNVMEIQKRDVILGDPKAPVTLIEYGDYQCPFCVRFSQQTEPSMRENYIKNGKLRMVFRNFQFLGSESTAAGAAAECAKDQNRFWAFHDALYAVESKDGRENNGNLTRDTFLQIAGDLKLNTAAFASCVDSQKYASAVQQDTQNAQTVAGVNSTPTLFLNGQKLLGALPYDSAAGAPGTAAMKPLIDQALAGK